MSTLLEKRYIRTIPVFYAQATATRARRSVFAVLLIWSLVEAGLTARDWIAMANEQFGVYTGLVIGILGFCGSLFLSLLFLGFLAMVWDAFSTHRFFNEPKHIWGQSDHQTPCERPPGEGQ